ncbi:hypothetical protein [Chloroflexus sp.]|uniref:hypothetical protein n=1 Tax=Chloroflexus sp. TaxID=1904827 RepID=UPI00262C4929|nr:hypothetical protein [uncultured Chloroflexus sp.]
MATRRVESFLVRIVVSDDEKNTTKQWHGRIQHIGTGLECRIDQLDELLSFISNHLRQNTAASDTTSSPGPTG